MKAREIEQYSRYISEAIDLLYHPTYENKRGSEVPVETEIVREVALNLKKIQTALEIHKEKLLYTGFKSKFTKESNIMILKASGKTDEQIKMILKKNRNIRKQFKEQTTWQQH